jgi:hypothetical protein
MKTTQVTATSPQPARGSASRVRRSPEMAERRSEITMRISRSRRPRCHAAPGRHGNGDAHSYSPVSSLSAIRSPAAWCTEASVQRLVVDEITEADAAVPPTSRGDSSPLSMSCLDDGQLGVAGHQGDSRPSASYASIARMPHQVVPDAAHGTCRIFGVDLAWSENFGSRPQPGRPRPDRLPRKRVIRDGRSDS